MKISMVQELEIARVRVSEAEKMMVDLRIAMADAEELRPLLRQRHCLTGDIKSLYDEMVTKITALAMQTLTDTVSEQTCYIGMLEEALAETAGFEFEDDGTITQEE